MYRSLLLITACTMLAACAGNRPAGDTKTVPARAYANEAEARQAAEDDDLICTYEKTVGSNLKKAICLTREQREAQAEASREEMQRLQRTKPTDTGNR